MTTNHPQGPAGSNVGREDMTDTQFTVITAADTTAAREWFDQAERDGLIRRGSRKDFPLVQAFARHRIQASSSQSAELERLRAALDRIAREQVKLTRRDNGLAIGVEADGYAKLCGRMRNIAREALAALKPQQEAGQ